MTQKDKYQGKKGSERRCLILTNNGKDELQKSLIDIIGSETVDKLKIKFTEPFDYFPKGFSDLGEIEIDKVKLPIDVPFDYCTKLNKWWLAKSAKTPNWDIVCNAEIDGSQGLILVEAKAYHNEFFRDDDSSGAEPGSQNRNKIDNALSTINSKYGYKLTANNYYQISNRIAWGIKLASMGIPAVLIYLGCKNTTEMEHSCNNPLITSKGQWDGLVRKYSELVGFRDWEKKIPGKLLHDASCPLEPSFFYPIIRSKDIQ